MFVACCYKHDICISRIVTQNTLNCAISTAKFRHFSGEGPLAIPAPISRNPGSATAYYFFHGKLVMSVSTTDRQASRIAAFLQAEAIVDVFMFQFSSPKVTTAAPHCISTTWGTGIRGLMRRMANLPQGNQELLVVRDKVGRPQVSLA